MADRHELSEIEYQRYRTEVLDSLFTYQEESAGWNDNLVVRSRDLESLVSELTDSIVYRVVEDRKRVAEEHWAAAPFGFIGTYKRVVRFLKARILPDYLPPQDREDWLTIWTRVLLIWYVVNLIVTLSIERIL